MDKTKLKEDLALYIGNIDEAGNNVIDGLSDIIVEAMITKDVVLTPFNAKMLWNDVYDMLDDFVEKRIDFHNDNSLNYFEKE